MNLAISVDNYGWGARRRRTLASGLLTVMLFLCGAACGTGNTAGLSEPQTITVFAASSLTDVLTAITEDFRLEHPGVHVELNLAGSQELRLQLEHGARADVFLSADPRQMALAAAAGLLTGPPVVFATNRLVVIAAKPNGANSRSERVQDQHWSSGAGALAALKHLADPGVSLALASPEVPAGAYARETIQRLEGLFASEMDHYADKVLANTATEEANVRSVAMKVALGEVDRGFVYATDAMTPFVSENTVQIQIPPEASPEATYLAAAVETSSTGSRSPELADRFIRYLLSPPGQQVMQSHGFGPPPAIDSGIVPSGPEGLPASSAYSEGHRKGN